jgi:hypothetical protein
MPERKTLPVPAAAREAVPEMPRPRDEAPKVREIGGPKGPEPTRYGDWEHRGRCSDF